MRNEPKPLDELTARRVYKLRDHLLAAQVRGDKVHMNYTKRDGSKGAVRNAEIQFFSGRDGMDTMSVTVADPRKPHPSTINLCRIVKAAPA